MGGVAEYKGQSFQYPSPRRVTQDTSVLGHSLWLFDHPSLQPDFPLVKTRPAVGEVIVLKIDPSIRNHLIMLRIETSALEA